MRLRQHQLEFKETIEGVVSGSSVQTIILDATPGAGKSLIPVLAAQLISDGIADALLWVVPRKSLQDQGERAFVDPVFREMLGHNFTIRTSKNNVDCCRGLSGAITTYQAISMDNRNLISDFNRKRYILILDENHHVSAGEDALWMASLLPLVQKAVFRVFMTGTMTRWDQEKIAFIDYENGKPVFDEKTKFIKYGRTMALREKAIIPLRFSLSDGQAAWEKNGRRQEVNSISKVFRPQDVSAALFTALRTDFAKNLLNKALDHWTQYRARTGHMSAFLIVTADYEHAKQILKHLRSRGLVDTRIATSHESTHAQKAIKDYRAGEFDIIVSINMAAEGLDVPRITHIACLTHVRSSVWIEQCLARAVRIDKSIPYEQQEAFVFAPDDWFLRRIVDGIKKEQTAVALKNKKDLESFEMLKGEPTEGGAREPDVIPIGSALTGDRSIFLGGPIETQVPQEPAPMPKTPTEIEAETRKDIEEHIRRFCFKNRYQPQKINSELKKHLGKARSEMTIDELGKTRSFVRQNYPLAPIHHMQRPGFSKPRGKGRRASSMGVIVDPPQQGCLWEARAF